MSEYTINITIRYEDETVNTREHRGLLYANVTRAIERGLLSPTGEEAVDEYSMDVYTGIYGVSDEP